MQLEEIEIDEINYEEVVTCAKQQIGKPYVHGGSGPNSFDCSGLTSYCYKKAGKAIPRAPLPQCKMGKKVTSPAPGDIVCMQFTSFGQKDIGHVGISLGGTRMIHAPQPGQHVENKDMTNMIKNGRVKYYVHIE